MIIISIRLSYIKEVKYLFVQESEVKRTTQTYTWKPAFRASPPKWPIVLQLVPPTLSLIPVDRGFNTAPCPTNLVCKHLLREERSQKSQFLPVKHFFRMWAGRHHESLLFLCTPIWHPPQETLNQHLPVRMLGRPLLS